ncbi:ABC transporter ATP-binding protein [Brachybacterium sp. AOP25-B2-12]|uniref:ABC transporter ATP-binding protein n=1 Tax=Brachybacterium sp. AOP25-B2-12 TaxID=3457710 RepID=UPI0040333049
MTTSDAAGITFESLTKRYGHHTAVDHLTFTCEPGTVTGFLGPNGAGKSTSLRILTGLAQADSGTALIGGRSYTDLARPGRTVGIMLDARSLHSGRTGLETLRLAAVNAGVAASRADAVLEQVGLQGAARKRVGGYSYGMRQRLGIGVALIGEPSTLILDEPANGLDPEGIRWMRQLLRGFAAAGGTVLLSSHQLAEVQATVDRLVVIARGGLVSQGTLDEVLGASGTRVGVTEPQRLIAALDRLGSDHTTHENGLIDVPLEPEAVGRLALDERLVLTSLGSIEDNGLEEVFFSLTSGSTGTTPTTTSSADRPVPVEA